MTLRIAGAVLLGLLGVSAGSAQTEAKLEKRWLYLPTNLYVAENVVKAEALLRRAKAAGYNGVLFADYKTGFWWKLDDPDRWQTNAAKLRQVTRDLGFTLAVAVMPFGYSGAVLTHDVNLAAGIPIVDCPLVARGGVMVPEPTVRLANGSFEDHRGDATRGFAFQDDPGRGSFIDTAVAISLGEPRVFVLVAEEVRRARQALDPDAYFLSHDEIRVGGYEPQEAGRYKTSGELLAANLARCTAIARQEGGGKPVFVWSDMFDPNHNAKADYYLVNNTLEGSWAGLDAKVTVMKWGGGKIARAGLEFFADRGNAQMIAAFYDGDPAADHAMWTAAAAGIPKVEGAMYTTWRNDYGMLERFAELWWGGGK